MVLFVASCSADDTPPGDVMPTVAATTSIWADVVGEATCNLVAIETLIPLGADPHAFEPSLADRHLMDSAELIVANGLFLEEGLHDTIESAHESGTPVFYFAEHVDTISYSAVDHDDDHDDDASDEHGHESGDDPHVWFDPTVVAAALDDLAGHLIDDVGLAAVDVDRCVGAYQNRLGELDAEIEAIVDNIPPDNRKLVTSHDSLGYFADRYGFEIIGTVIPTPSGLAETNPAQLDELSHIIEAAGVRAIFTERQASDEDAVALADRLDNVAVVALHSGSLGDPASGADTYVSMMRSNARLIGQALAEANASSPLAVPDTESANPITDPIAYWVEPFTDSAANRHAFVAAFLAAITTSLVGTWVVLRGMAFLGDALAHGVLPGIALAFVLGVDTTLGAFVAALVMVGGVSLIRSQSALPEDTSIGVLFVGFLALAVVIMSSQSGSYSGDLNRFLFGSITAVDNTDLTRQAIAAVVALVVVAVFYRAFLVLTFDETLAELLGMRPKLAHGLLLALMAISIVASFETVGNLLVFSFLIAPPATAALLVHRVPIIMITSMAIGTLSVAIGLVVSFNHGTAAGATMALSAVIIFLAVLFASSIFKALTPGDR